MRLPPLVLGPTPLPADTSRDVILIGVWRGAVLCGMRSGNLTVWQPDTVYSGQGSAPDAQRIRSNGAKKELQLVGSLGRLPGPPRCMGEDLRGNLWVGTTDSVHKYTWMGGNPTPPAAQPKKAEAGPPLWPSSLHFAVTGLQVATQYAVLPHSCAPCLGMLTCPVQYDAGMLAGNGCHTTHRRDLAGL